MWLIIRKKRSINEVLKNFFPDYQQQMVRVRDIIKFGRVNFKISALYCDRIDPIYNGTCYQPPNTTHRHEKTHAEEGIGPLPQNKAGASVTQVLENSMEQNQNITEMNLVNDVSTINRISNLANDVSAATFANQDQTQSQVLLDAADLNNAGGPSRNQNVTGTDMTEISNMNIA